MDEFAYYLRLKDSQALIKNVFDLLTAVDIPHSLKEAGVRREDFEERIDKLVENALFDGTTVTIRRYPTDEEFKKIFHCAYEGKEVDF